MKTKLTLVNSNWQHEGNSYGWTDEGLVLTSDMNGHLNHHLINKLSVSIGQLYNLKGIIDNEITLEKLSKIEKVQYEMIDYIKSLEQLVCEGSSHCSRCKLNGYCSLKQSKEAL